MTQQINKKPNNPFKLKSKDDAYLKLPQAPRFNDIISDDYLKYIFKFSNDEKRLLCVSIDEGEEYIKVLIYIVLVCSNIKTIFKKRKKL